MDFENDTFYSSEESTTLDEPLISETRVILPEVCRTGQCDPGDDSGRLRS